MTKITLATYSENFVFEHENPLILKQQVINKLRMIVFNHLSILLSNEFDTFEKPRTFDSIVEQISICHKVLSRDYMPLSFNQIAFHINTELYFLIRFY
jgi:hypothetical protein